MKRQIEEQLLFQLMQFFLMDNPPEELRQQCHEGLSAEINRIATNELYRKSKTAHTQSEREAALIDWYNAKGIPEAYRIITRTKE